MSIALSLHVEASTLAGVMKSLQESMAKIEEGYSEGHGEDDQKRFSFDLKGCVTEETYTT